MSFQSYWHNLIEPEKQKYAPFEVKVDYTNEQEPLEDLFPDEGEAWYKETARKVERSEMPYVIARATVSLAGVKLADNTLGGLLYDSWEEFEKGMMEDEHELITETVDLAHAQWSKMQALMTQHEATWPS
jgi:hypothetical protein